MDASFHVSAPAVPWPGKVLLVALVWKQSGLPWPRTYLKVAGHGFDRLIREASLAKPCGHAMDS